MSNDGGEIIVLWCPSQHRGGAVGSRDDLCWIAGAAWCDFDLEIDTTNTLHHLNDLTHRETMAVASVTAAPPARE